MRTWMFPLHKGMLVVPMRDSDGTLRSLQFIDADGVKRFLTDGRKAGCYFSIGKPGNRIWIAEVYATGASIHAATPWPWRSTAAIRTPWVRRCRRSTRWRR